MRRHAFGDPVMRGGLAKRYAWMTRWFLSGFYRSVAAEVGVVAPQGGHVLDVGTGPGRLLLCLAQCRPDLELIGVDPSEDMVALARQTLTEFSRVRVEVGSAEELPLPDASVDVVISTLSAHHWADARRALAEQARVLCSGGRLTIYDARRRGLPELAGWLDEVGLTPVSGDRAELGPVARVLLTSVQGLKPE